MPVTSPPPVHALTGTWAMYKDVTVQLASLRGELAEMLKAECEVRAETYAMSSESTVKARERESDVAVLNTQLSIIDKKAEVLAAEDMRTFLQDAVRRNVEVMF